MHDLNFSISNSDMRRYIASAFLLMVIILAAAIVLNVLIDPYAIHDSTRHAGINLEKPALSANERLYKAQLAQTAATTVILGTSRSEVGIDPTSPAFGAGPIINLATSNQPYRETLELLQVASARGVRRAIVGLDFFAANDWRRYPSTYSPGMYAGINRWELAASMSTLLASYNTVRNQDPHRLAAVGAQLREDGMRLLGDGYISGQGGHYRLFLDTETSYLRDAYPQHNAFGLDLSDGGTSEMKCALRLFEYAHQHGIELYVFISPSHAQLWETLYQSGLWDKWEAWKRRLVAMGQLAAREAGTSPFDIVDFSGFNAFTTEPVPPQSQPSARMQWYIEASHYRPALGELVLERLLTRTSTDHRAADFGTSIDTTNIDGSLSDIRASHTRWRAANPTAVDDIAAALSRSILSRRRNATVQERFQGQGCS
jgi:hypothetical protein